MPDNVETKLPPTARLEGQIVDHSFTLARFLYGTEEFGRFATEADGQAATLELHPYSEERLEAWTAVQSLKSCLLVRIIAVGTFRAGGERFAYIVTETPLESVAEVLEERALDANEAREVLSTLLRALTLLHANNLVHSAVDPSSIVAVQDAIKLTAGPVRHADHTRTAELDIRAAGVTVFQALTRRLPSAKHFFEVSALPAPFSIILLRCLEDDPQQRRSSAELLALLENNPPPRSALAEMSNLPNGAKQGSAPALDESMSEIPAPPVPRKIVVTPAFPSKRDLEDPNASPRIPIFALVAVAVLLIAQLVALGIHKAGSEHATVRSAQAKKTIKLPESNPPIQQSPPAVASPAPSASPLVAEANPTPPPAPAANIDENPANWRVIAFTYTDSAVAERKVETLKKKRPEWKAEVFSPQPGRFLVSIGSWMTRQDAIKLRKKVRGHGLPRDTYTQNFTR